MRLASLKLKIYAKNYTSNVSIIDDGNLRKRILNIMLCTLGFLAFFYVFFLGSMILNIIERKSLESYALTLSSEVGNLELEYLSASEKIDLNLAYSLGFKEIKAKFANRNPLGSLNIAKNEI